MSQELPQTSQDIIAPPIAPESELPYPQPPDGLINQLINQVQDGVVDPPRAVRMVWRKFYAGSLTSEQLNAGLNTLIESFPPEVCSQLEQLDEKGIIPLRKIAQEEQQVVEARKRAQEAEAKAQEEKQLAEAEARKAAEAAAAKKTQKKKRKPKSVRIYERRTKAQARRKGQIYP